MDPLWRYLIHEQMYWCIKKKEVEVVVELLALIKLLLLLSIQIDELFDTSASGDWIFFSR